MERRHYQPSSCDKTHSRSSTHLFRRWCCWKTSRTLQLTIPSSLKSRSTSGKAGQWICLTSCSLTLGSGESYHCLWALHFGPGCHSGTCPCYGDVTSGHSQTDTKTFKWVTVYDSPLSCFTWLYVLCSVLCCVLLMCFVPIKWRSLASNFRKMQKHLYVIWIFSFPKSAQIRSGQPSCILQCFNDCIQLM